MVSGGKDERSIAAGTGLVVPDWESVDKGEVGDVLMGCWVVNRVDIVGSKVELELTSSVVEETPSDTVVGFKDVWDGLTKDSDVDAGMEEVVLGSKDV